MSSESARAPRISNRIRMIPTSFFSGLRLLGGGEPHFNRLAFRTQMDDHALSDLDGRTGGLLMALEVLRRRRERHGDGLAVLGLDFDATGAHRGDRAHDVAVPVGERQS